MHHKEHARSCIELFGAPFDEIHSFLDQFWAKYRISHRRLLHHWLGIELIVKQFGKEARAPAELHIIQDLGCIPRTWIDHDPFTVYLERWDREQQEEELVRLYGQEKYDEVTRSNR